MKRRLFLLAALALPVLLLLATIGRPIRFFVPLSGQDALTTNPRFGWIFFSPSLARTPVPCVLRDPKPPHTYRIFLLGSSAAMGVPDPAFSFGRMLEVMLREAWPDRRVEVVNAAMTAINSHALVPIASDCARYQPDLFLVYAGNNEVVGPYGPGTVFARFSSSLPLIRASIWARSTRVGQWFRRDPPQEWGGMEMFLNRQVRHDDPRLAAVYSHYRQNLTEVARIARAAGARVIFSTVATNRKDQPPFGGDAARAAFRRGQFAPARDLDALRFRADSWINEIVRAVAGAELVDADRSLDGREQFYEHVHLTFDGNYALASLFFRKLTGRDPPARVRVAEALACTPWNEHQMALYMFRLMSRPPFTAPPELRAPAPGPEALAESRRMYQEAVERSPDDLLLRVNFARLLSDLTDPAAAETQWRALAGRLPDHLPWRVELAGVLSDQGRLEPAAAELASILAADATLAPAHFTLGVIRDRQHNPAAATAAYQEALRHDPFLARAHNNLGRLLLGQQAAMHFRRAVDLEPDFAEARYNLGGALAAMGRIDSAIGEFRAVVRLRPGFPDAHYNLGILLARQDRHAEATTHYQDVLRLRPDWAEARNNLGKALALQGKKAAAIAEFRRALELKPGLEEARQNLDRAQR